MDLLAAISPDGLVQPTQLTRKLVIDGRSQTYQVYRIRLDLLFYNAQNDRIATWISQYKAEHDGQLPEETDIEAYNSIIEEFIVKSNEDAIKKTANNIRLFDQQVPGVVLSNGLLIDGNRRFTCLRRLAKEDPRFNWLEAVILPEEIASDPKRIKILELNIQHAEEGKVDYDPVERLVGVYNDVIHSGLLSVEEYARNTNTPVSEINKMIKSARLMVEFLEFINAPEQFHLAREMAINGPLNEIPAILRYCPDEDTEETVKSCIFANMVVEPAGDITRHVRKFKKILQSPGAKGFIDEQSELAAEVVDRLALLPVVNKDTIRNDIRADQNLIDRFALSVEKAELEARGAKILSTPLDNINKASDLLDEVDVTILGHLTDEDVKKAIKALRSIEERVNDILEAASRDQLADEA